MNPDRVTSGRDVPDDVNVIIEIPMNAGPIKYEVDKATGAEEAKQEILAGVERYRKAKTKPKF